MRRKPRKNKGSMRNRNEKFQSFQFNLTGMRSILRDAIIKGVETIAFEIKEGEGKFIFMMFISDDDESKDIIYILMVGTRTLIEKKMYGNHRKGDFLIYIKNDEAEKFRQEIGGQGGQNAFQIGAFLEKVNGRIPEKTSRSENIKCLSENKNSISEHQKIRRKVDESQKIYLIGTMKLPEGKSPSELRMRKLSLYLDADPSTISWICDKLRERNRTTKWTDQRELAVQDISGVIAELDG